MWMEVEAFAFLYSLKRSHASFAQLCLAGKKVNEVFFLLNSDQGNDLPYDCPSKGSCISVDFIVSFEPANVTTEELDLVTLLTNRFY